MKIKKTMITLMLIPFVLSLGACSGKKAEQPSKPSSAVTTESNGTTDSGDKKNNDATDGKGKDENQTTNKKDAVNIKDVVSITLYPDDFNKPITYNVEKSKAEVERFITAYNEAEPTGDDKNFVHRTTVVILLKNGEKASVSGGSMEDYQTVTIKGKQFNVKGKKLDDYMTTVKKMYTY